MIQFMDKSLQPVSQSDEVENVVVFAQRTFDGRFDSPIVAVQSLTDRSIKRDKMRGGENQRVFGNADSELSGAGMHEQDVFEVELGWTLCKWTSGDRGDVSPLMFCSGSHQGTDVPRSPNAGQNHILWRLSLGLSKRRAEYRAALRANLPNEQSY